MYCKYFICKRYFYLPIVLIVAKCIVNVFVGDLTEFVSFVLIVAKCIVNIYNVRVCNIILIVLIVAKCIVNLKEQQCRYYKNLSINSSKVYCKYSSNP